MTSDTYITER